jgi:hypothetical protein
MKLAAFPKSRRASFGVIMERVRSVGSFSSLKSLAASGNPFEIMSRLSGTVSGWEVTTKIVPLKIYRFLKAVTPIEMRCQLQTR